uniref:CD81 molecule n=1 Tax=Paramormyrops kingsleyae TaxID=1676925 RepID=A0A3B3SL17_9TELE
MAGRSPPCTHPCIFGGVGVFKERPHAPLPAPPQPHGPGIGRVPQRQPSGHLQLLVAVPWIPHAVCVPLVVAYVGGPSAKAVQRLLGVSVLPLAGGLILGVALWLRHDNQTSKLLMLQLGDQQAPSTFYISIYILISVGAVMMFVGFLGCYGAIQESQCLLGTFFTCLVILFACEVAAGIWGYMNRETIAKELITFYDTAYDQNIMSNNKNQAASTVLKVFHETLECCGKGDLKNLFTQLAPDLCPLTTPGKLELTKNCHSQVKELFDEKLYLVGIAALVVAVIMIFEMILSMVLCCAIRNNPGY